VPDRPTISQIHLGFRNQVDRSQINPLAALDATHQGGKRPHGQQGSVIGYWLSFWLAFRRSNLALASALSQQQGRQRSHRSAASNHGAVAQPRQHIIHQESWRCRASGA
jgi:hypothetical protein